MNPYAEHLEILAPPEQGQVVRARGGNWMVSSVISSDAADDATWVNLEAVDTDEQGSLEILWEQEPNARVIDTADLPPPDRFDTPSDMKVFLNAVRWGAASTADLRALQAPFRSGIEIEEYQLDPLVRAIEMPRANLLIADDVGLGKTIEAGLIIQEFIISHRARSVLIVCPSPIQTHWKTQMLQKFGLDFRIVDSASMKELRRRRGVKVNPWSHFPRLITSMDFIKRPVHMRRFNELVPSIHEGPIKRKFDILVVDEAHNVTPRGQGKYPVDSERTKCIAAIRKNFEHGLYLSATPHDGNEQSFAALMALIDPQRFARNVPPDEDQKRAVIVRRLKSELKFRADGSRRFPDRDVECLKVPFTDEENQAHALLKELADVDDQGDRSPGTGFVMKTLKKRLFSSPRSFSSTFAKFEESLGIQRSSNTQWAKKKLKEAEQRLEDYDGDYSEEDDQLDSALKAAAKAGVTLRSGDKTRTDQLRKWASQASHQKDSKAEQLFQFIQQNLCPGGQWNDRRVIVFTEYRDTLNYLKELFAGEGWNQKKRVEFIHGGTDSEAREKIQNDFRASPDKAPVRILVATDTASEGIDLQKNCDLLIHYEVPWNPSRMEQRNGRIDRYGQPSEKVRVFHFVDSTFEENSDKDPGSLAGDLEFIFRAVKKLEVIDRDLFGKVSPVIAAQVEEAMLGKRTQLRTESAEEEGRRVARDLRMEKDHQERVRQLHDKLEETRDLLQVDADSIRAVVAVGLRLAHQPPLQEDTHDGVPVFRVPDLSGSWMRTRAGLLDPQDHSERPISFDAAVAANREDIVYAHLHNPLVQSCVRLVRAQVWKERGKGDLQRVTVRSAPKGSDDPLRVIAHARLVIVGSSGKKLHEELLMAGGVFQDGRFRRTGVTETKQAIEDSIEGSEKTEPEMLLPLWEKIEDPLRKSIEVRRDGRFEALAKQLDDRCQKHQKDVKASLEELARTIKEAFAEDEGQLELFQDEEREQWESDRSDQERRLDRIPDEIVHEQAAIAERFANPSSILFPVGVTWILPDGGLS